MRKRANANTSISSPICAPHHAPLTKNKPGSFDDTCVSRLVFCYECLAELFECPAFNFHARLTHQVQIKMQIVQRDQAKPENFFCLNEVTNVAARKVTAGITPAVVFYRPFVQRELCVL